jgi:hypothetical protein
MSIGGQLHLLSVTLDDVIAEATRWPMSAAQARRAALDTLERLEAALDAVAIPDRLASLVRERSAAMRVS